MDAVEFLRKAQRMCDSFGDCECCPGVENACPINDTDKRENPEGVVAAVEKWEKDHPIKTRQSEFLKMFPNADIDCILPCDIDKTLFKAHCHDDDCGCTYCKTQYWNEEVSDND